MPDRSVAIVRRLLIASSMLLLFVGSPSPVAAASACRFQLGFAALQRLLPEQVGTCLESEQHNPVTGDAQQRTTGGLLVWRRTTNLTSFTDGRTTWVLGSTGLQQRPNDQRLPAEAAWPTYLHDPERTAANANSALSPTTAPALLRQWAFATGGGIAAQPVVVDGTVYVGSWDGNEYAIDAATGGLRWKTFLGVIDSGGRCTPNVIGVTSTATVQDGVVYVGGGDDFWYALDASTGAVRWKVRVGDTSAAVGDYNWSSPLLWQGFAYIGVASMCDNPLAQGKLLQVDLQQHRIARTFDVVPTGQTGGGIWTSPALDPGTNTLYLTTGNRHASGEQPYAESVLALNATTPAVTGQWQHPFNADLDADWGTTPTLFMDAAGRPLLAVGHKEGAVYALDRRDLGAGPVWQRPVAQGGSCPTCGQGTIASSAFTQGRLYVGGGQTTVGGQAVPGAARALDPATGRVLWERAMPGPVVAALASGDGLVVAAGGDTLEVLAAATGATLFHYATGGPVDSPPSLSGDQLFVGSTDGHVYAFGLPGR
jgi:outer membrane protein assembly factor BamB